MCLERVSDIAAQTANRGVVISNAARITRKGSSPCAIGALRGAALSNPVGAGVEIT
jgi:hypothetical protein